MKREDAVAIVGAGPAGLAMAIALADAGVAATVLDLAVARCPGGAGGGRPRDRADPCERGHPAGAGPLAAAAGRRDRPHPRSPRDRWRSPGLGPALPCARGAG